MRIKKEDGKPRYSVTLFDPNLTTTHVRAASDGPGAFLALELRSFFEPDFYKIYHPNIELSGILVRPGPCRLSDELDSSGEENRGESGVQGSAHNEVANAPAQYGKAEDRYNRMEARPNSELDAAKKALQETPPERRDQAQRRFDGLAKEIVKKKAKS